MLQVFDFRKKARNLKEAFVPIHITEIDNMALRIAKIEGEYRWHVHPHEDEFFIVIEGEVEIETKNQTVTLREWQGTLVPRNTPHRSKAKKPALVLIIEPVQTNTRGVILEEP